MPTTPGSDQSCKSKEITQPPVRGPKGTGTAKEKGITTPILEEDRTRKSMTAMGKDQSQKSKDIASTPARGQKGTWAVNPGDQPISERVQQYSKKKREDQKKTMDQYFGGGKRVPPPSKVGTTVQSILLQRVATPHESTTGTKDAVGRQLNSTLPKTKGEGGTTAANIMEVDLEGFNPGVQSKGNGLRKRDKKGNEERKTEEQFKKTGARKPKIAFGPTEVVKEKPFTYKECVVDFAIRVNKGNNAKQAFDKKLMEGLEFIQQYVDKRTCFLPHDKTRSSNLFALRMICPITR